ncbi:MULTISPECIES: acylphosphatase [unclassified Luteimonas]|jgi:acylphosphatase|uniref:acylphosphatase n=1 Tax=unclassified Luteimonas TaxID=2629088 RepID=UPI00047BDDD8|nr:MULTISPECIES: acylphosphatase [unclassified Luteimonas]
MKAALFRVDGRVQGVGFRAATRAQALALGLRGHVRNLVDGGVEVLAVGGDAAIEALAQWLEDGPPAARVQHLARTDLPQAPDVPQGFVIAGD